LREEDDGRPAARRYPMTDARAWRSCFLIVGDEGAQLANDERGLDRGDERLDHRRLERSRRLPLDDGYLADIGVGRNWLVMAMRMRSGRSRLYCSELTTTAGRLLIVVWSVKGKGTTITSPKRNAIGDSVHPVVDVVFGIAPSLAEDAFRGASRRPNQLAIGVSLRDEVDEVLDLRHTLGREATDLLEQLIVWRAHR
jgi:hypothetical protein